MTETRQCRHKYEEVIVEVALKGDLCYYRAYHVYEEVRMAGVEGKRAYSLGYILTGMQYATFKQMQVSYPSLNLVCINPLELIEKRGGLT